MTTVGDLTANMIGRKTIRTTHQHCTITGELSALEIETRNYEIASYSRPAHQAVGDVKVTIRLGAITLGPLERDHKCEVIA